MRLVLLHPLNLEFEPILLALIGLGVGVLLTLVAVIVTLRARAKQKQELQQLTMNEFAGGDGPNWQQVADPLGSGAEPAWPQRAGYPYDQGGVAPAIAPAPVQEPYNLEPARQAVTASPAAAPAFAPSAPNFQDTTRSPLPVIEPNDAQFDMQEVQDYDGTQSTPTTAQPPPDWETLRALQRPPEAPVAAAAPAPARTPAAMGFEGEPPFAAPPAMRASGHAPRLAPDFYGDADESEDEPIAVRGPLLPVPSDELLTSAPPVAPARAAAPAAASARELPRPPEGMPPVRAPRAEEPRLTPPPQRAVTRHAASAAYARPTPAAAQPAVMRPTPADAQPAVMRQSPGSAEPARTPAPSLTHRTASAQHTPRPEAGQPEPAAHKPRPAEPQAVRPRAAAADQASATPAAAPAQHGAPQIRAVQPGDHLPKQPQRASAPTAEREALDAASAQARTEALEIYAEQQRAQKVQARSSDTAAPAESSRPGAGERRAARAAAPSGRAAAAPQTASKTVLVVDDSATIRRAFQLLFGATEYQVVAVASGADAVDEARRVQPDLVIADLSLDEVDGYEICRELRADSELSGVPVLLMHGPQAGFDPTRADQVGANGDVEKPFKSQDVLDLVASLTL